jgi:ABC-2 type transport system ATP-binding protein
VDHPGGKAFVNNSDPVIKTENLIKDYKSARGVDGLNLAIRQGELFGLVGPDGAGKTTTLRILAGLLNISDGTAEELGFDLKKDAEAIKSHIGYMAQQFSLYAELTVAENLQFFADLYNVSSSDFDERKERLMDFAGLTQFTQRRASDLSGGMQKKLALACTLIHEPELLLLDEPTTGVDPISRREFWDILSELHLQKVTIVVSTPYMDEADRCSTVGLLYEGHLIECDAPTAIRQKIKGDVIEIQSGDWQKAISIVKDLEGIREVQTYGESIHLLVDSGEKRLKSIKKTLTEANVVFSNIRIAPVRMEEAFISLIKKME